MTNILTDQLYERASKLGFDVVKITTAELPKLAGLHLEEFVDANWHGSMAWFADTLERRKSPTAMWPDAKSAIVLATNYGPQFNPLDRLQKKSTGNISVYALNRDYHDVIKGKLKQLAGWFASQSGHDVRVFVDTAPLMEKPLAAQAGVGWQGKHTNLVSRDFGSWLFLGVILTAAELPQDNPSDDHCGQCRACIEICPTRAIPEPYKVDARRCISYLTIEFEGHIPEEFRRAIGNRIYGCDDCLAVCPWNKFAEHSQELKFRARSDLLAPDLAELAHLTDPEFRKLFSGSPVKRIGRQRFIRNVLIAVGNSKNSKFIATANVLLNDPSVQIRAMAIWALKQLVNSQKFTQLAEEHMNSEIDSNVLAEWEH